MGTDDARIRRQASPLMGRVVRRDRSINNVT